MPNSCKCREIVSISDHPGRNDRLMDGGNGCSGKDLDCVSGGDERNSKRKLNDGISCSEDGYAGSQSKFVAVEVVTESGSSSGDIDSQDTCNESSNHVALTADEDIPVSTREGEGSTVNGNDAHNISSIVGEGGSVERVRKSPTLVRMDKGADTGTKLTKASKRQWPKWTVSYMTSLSTMEKVMSYYRALDLADNLSDKDLRCFLEEQLCKEKAGLPETTIRNRLRTKLYESGKVCEADSCSICMVEYKDQDEIASLYYCSHEYHAGCIKEWLLKNNLCPMCRALAVIPEEYPCWDGDVRLHQAFFVHLKFAAS